MSNKLAEMSKVEDSNEGVNVRVTGDVQRGTVERMVEKCNTGTESSCCGPEFFEQISGISVSGQDGDVTIHIAGSVTSEMIEHNLAECDCYDKQLAPKRQKTTAIEYGHT